MNLISPDSTVFRLLTHSLCHPPPPPPRTRTVSPDPAVSRFPYISLVHKLASLDPAVSRTPLALSLGTSISPDPAVSRLPLFALYTGTSLRFYRFKAPLFPLYTHQYPTSVDPSCLRDSVGLRRVEGRVRKRREKPASGMLLIHLISLVTQRPKQLAHRQPLGLCVSCK